MEGAPPQTEHRELPPRSNLAGDRWWGPLALRARLWFTQRALERRYDAPPAFSRQPMPEELGLSAGLWKGSERQTYVPSAYGLLRRILRPQDVDRDDVFIDIGCGAGRIVVQAADRYRLRRVIGLDFVPELVEIAQEAVDRNRDRFRCPDVELVVADAVDYAIPDDVTIAYLFDPFRGRMFDAVIQNLIASFDRNPRSLRIIYGLPREHDRLLATGRIRFVKAGRRLLRRWRPAHYIALYEVVPDPGTPP